MTLSRLLLIPAACLLLAEAVLAQGRAAPAPRRAEPAASCLVSEFRAMALSTHDLNARAGQATDWIRRNASACSEEQLRLIRSNRTAWLGNADSPQIMGLLDSALEARIKNNPELLGAMFGATPPPRPAANETLRAGELAPRPAPVVAGTPASVTTLPPGAAMAVPVPVPAPVPGAGRPPVVLPPGTLPPGTKPPEVGRHFDDKLRAGVREYFTANRGNGPCPTGLVLKDGRCESATAQRAWKLGQPLPGQLTPKDLPARLAEQLGPPPPGHRYLLADGDILLVAEATGVVVDAVLDLGQVPPKP